MQAGDGDVAIIIEPNDNSRSTGINSSMIRAGDAVTIPAAGDNREGLERTSLQTLANIRDHCIDRLPKPDEPRKAAAQTEA